MFPVAIRGDAIELRELEPTDAASLAVVIADEAVLRYTTWMGPTDLEAAEGFVRMAQETAVATPRIEYLLAVALLATGEVIGAGGIRIEDEASQVGWLRFILRHDWWGRGVATEAAKLAIRFGFEQLGLGRIEADPALGNVAAHKVLEKVGNAPRRPQNSARSVALRTAPRRCRLCYPPRRLPGLGTTWLHPVARLRDFAMLL
ncbi:MAG: GNAT family N-acetyltransferase [Actinomycetota bacterium]